MLGAGGLEPYTLTKIVEERFQEVVPEEFIVEAEMRDGASKIARLIRI